MTVQWGKAASGKKARELLRKRRRLEKAQRGLQQSALTPSVEQRQVKQYQLGNCAPLPVLVAPSPVVLAPKLYVPMVVAPKISVVLPKQMPLKLVQQTEANAQASASCSAAAEASDREGAPDGDSEGAMASEVAKSAFDSGLLDSLGRANLLMGC